MKNKNQLYKNIINDISKIVKNKLDETFTTHPLYKIKKYFNKIKEELNINIDEYKEPSNFVKTEYLITNYFDDIQLDITHKTNNLFTSEEKEKINNKLQLIGYKLTRTFIDNFNIEHLFYTPNRQNTLNSKLIKSMNYLYHICPNYVVDKIKEKGFCPKAKNKLFTYDPRIHFCIGTIPYEYLRELTYLLDRQNNSNGEHKYSVIKIKCPQNIKFYKDLDYPFGVFTKENISPDYIEEINDIEPLSFIELLNKNLKQKAETDDLFGI